MAILSTGGSAKTLREAGVEVIEVSDHTGFPEIMDGRVKTLQPAIHGGILARRTDQGHAQALRDLRYGGRPATPTTAQRRGLRSELSRGGGLLQRLRAWWALPPHV